MKVDDFLYMESRHLDHIRLWSGWYDDNGVSCLRVYVSNLVIHDMWGRRHIDVYLLWGMMGYRFISRRYNDAHSLNMGMFLCPEIGFTAKLTYHPNFMSEPLDLRSSSFQCWTEWARNWTDLNGCQLWRPCFKLFWASTGLPSGKSLHNYLLDHHF